MTVVLPFSGNEESYLWARSCLLILLLSMSSLIMSKNDLLLTNFVAVSIFKNIPEERTIEVDSKPGHI